MRGQVYVFDFEQNLSGWIRLVLRFCAAGTAITFRHAELLQHPPYGPVDGNICECFAYAHGLCCRRPCHHCACEDVGNLRGAKATDTYICKGDPEGEDWQPVFTQHGFRCVGQWAGSKGTGMAVAITVCVWEYMCARFPSRPRRYVEVSGLKSPPTLDMITAINVRSAVEQIGTLSFSDPMMNNVQVDGREMVVGDGQGGRW